ncbi:flagellar biosynthesis protein FlhF [Salipaludibacillus sp. CF4.18]|uniref:flagellar biosynthesis protein FlhF n=1 Tax=Salipaludibacillus sp. CF4.18 TaxID=3373081 RepID=UPI003EE456AA
MKVKKYQAKDMAQAMTKIKNELGHNAVILNSKQVETGGFLGFFTKKSIEVIAALDQELPPVRSKKKVSPAKLNQTEQKETPNQLSSEIDELKRMITNMQGDGSSASEDYPEALQVINSQLIDQEIHSNYRSLIMKNLLRRWYKEEGENKKQNDIKEWLESELRALTSEASFGEFKYDKKYLNVVGPTGVGKTTTLAKIAARAVLQEKKKVAFVTTDTFRIAAIEQLKTYAKILNVPVEVAYSMEDFKEALTRLKDYDFILIDSAGRNYRNAVYVEQLNEIIDFNEETETHLVLAVTSKYRDMKKILEQFKLIKVDKLIFTKLDETETLGAMVNIIADSKIGSSYLTTGQNVPDDIEEATQENILERLIRR